MARRPAGSGDGYERAGCRHVRRPAELTVRGGATAVGERRAQRICGRELHHGESGKNHKDRENADQRYVRGNLRAKISSEPVGMTGWAEDAQRLEQKHVVKAGDEQGSGKSDRERTVDLRGQPTREREIDAEANRGSEPLIDD